MINDDIVNIVCKIENININKFNPTTETNEISTEEFDKNFSLDRIFTYEFHNFQKRIRFVKYSEDKVTIFIMFLKISNLLMNESINIYKTYSKGRVVHISIKEIERSFKLKTIINKMGS
jgi:phosphoketolase